MIPLLASAVLLWIPLRLFATLETENGFLRMLTISVGITVMTGVLQQIHPLLSLLVLPLLALTLWKWCLLPPRRAAAVTLIFLSCRIALDFWLPAGHPVS